MKTKATIILTTILLIFFAQASAQEKEGKVLIVSNKVGKTIDAAEKSKYHLFPFYSKATFDSAQFILMPDSIIMIKGYLNTGEFKDFKSSYAEFLWARSLIDHTKYIPPPKKEKPILKKVSSEVSDQLQPVLTENARRTRKQGFIYKKDSTVIKAQILSVGRNAITYTKFNDVDSTVNVISKSIVMKIRYEDGEEESFENYIRSKMQGGYNYSKTRKASRLRKMEEDPIVKDFNKNFISVNLQDLIFSNISISYERIINSGKVGFKIPVSVGLGKDFMDKTINENKTFSVGLDINLYPSGQGRVRQFLGPAFEYGLFKYGKFLQGSIKVSEPEPLNGSYYTFFFNTGLMVQPSKTINFILFVGVGWRTDRIKTYYYQLSKPFNRSTFAMNGGINFGFKF